MKDFYKERIVEILEGLSEDQLHTILVVIRAFAG